MWRAAIALAMLIVTGCVSEKPSEAYVDIIERQIARDPCVGDLSQWSRTYSFAVRGKDRLETDLIDVQFVRPGWDGAKAGRHIIGSPSPPGVDDRAYEMVLATYRRSTNELDLWACGDNAEPARHPPKF
jgi:hypothetical protein